MGELVRFDPDLKRDIIRARNAGLPVESWEHAERMNQLITYAKDREYMRVLSVPRTRKV